MTLSEHGKAWTRHTWHTQKNGNSTYHLAVFFFFCFFFVINKKSYALKVKPTLRDTLDLSTKWV